MNKRKEMNVTSLLPMTELHMDSLTDTMHQVGIDIKQLNESITMLTRGLENLDTKTQQSLDDAKKESYIRVGRVQKLLDNEVDLNIKRYKHWNTIQRRNKRFFTVLLINCILQAIFLLCLYYYVFWIQ